MDNDILTIHINSLPSGYTLVPIKLATEMKKTMKHAIASGKSLEMLWKDILEASPSVVPKLDIPKEENPKKLIIK